MELIAIDCSRNNICRTWSVKALHPDVIDRLSVLDEVPRRVHVGAEMLVLGKLVTLQPVAINRV